MSSAVCDILNDKDNLGKFDSKSDVGMFLGYDTNSMEFLVYNQRTKMILESINVVFDDKSRISLEEVTHEEPDATHIIQVAETVNQNDAGKVEENHEERIDPLLV